MQKIQNVTLGCDPEIFLKNSAGKFIASCDKIGGSKDAPLQIEGLSRGFAVQEDNVAVEFCIPPAGSKAEWNHHVRQALTSISDRFVKPIGLELAFGVSSTNFDATELQSEKAQTFGCDPDFNVYRLEENPRPEAVEVGLRTAGGHIHFGFANPTDDQRFAVVRAADVVLGLPSLFLDGDTKRRLMYGKAGAFRPKPYGVEYRTLSNFWIGSDTLIEWAYEQAMKAVDLVNNADKRLFASDTAIMTELAINKNNKAAAKAVMKKFGIQVPEV